MIQVLGALSEGGLTQFSKWLKCSVGIHVRASKGKNCQTAHWQAHKQSCSIISCKTFQDLVVKLGGQSNAERLISASAYAAQLREPLPPPMNVSTLEHVAQLTTDKTETAQVRSPCLVMTNGLSTCLCRRSIVDIVVNMRNSSICSWS